MGEITDKAQALTDRGTAQLLAAIRNAERVEKLACKAADMPAMIAANKVIISLRRSKNKALKASGLLDVTVKAGGT